MQTRLRRAVVAGAVSLLWTGSAWACGGLFCGNAGPGVPPAPVDQTAEIIAFEVGAETVTAHVQIQYTGSADAFAWVVPVSDPGVIVSESSGDFLAGLDLATRPNVIAPATPVCEDAVQPSFESSDSGLGCGCADESSSGAALNDRGGDVGFEDGVTIFDRDFTDNYEFAVISAVEAQDLVNWLQDNQFNVSDNMVPVMQPYTDANMIFVGIKLRDGKQASDIVPLKLTYVGTNPMIPIRLTAVAAQPLMGILVFILGNVGYAAENFSNVGIASDELSINAAQRINYFDWVARVSDERNGKAFVTEYLDTKPSGVGGNGAMLTRLYTRMSAHHMSTDPVFGPHPDPSFRIRATLDLSTHPPVVCNDFTGGFPSIPENQPSACAYNYCGAEGTCVEVNGQATCECPQGQVAQPFTGPDQNPKVTCMPQENPFGVTPEAAGVGTEFDPCNDMACGVGQCVVRNGFPVCTCNTGAVALVMASGSMGTECIDAPEDAESFGPGAGIESRGQLMSYAEPPRPGEGRLMLGLLVPMALGIVPLWLWRRRRSSQAD